MVGGTDPESTKRGVEFYEQVLDFDDRPDLARRNGVWAMGSAESAELAKLAETTYRDVNIALANEFAEFAEQTGLDIGEVIEASNSQPFSHIHRPGVAVGGHCIPVYPRFYLTGHPDARLVKTAREVNLDVPNRVIETIDESLSGLKGKSVLVLGVAYRGGVKESAYSGVFDLVDAVEARDGKAYASDPLYEPAEVTALGLPAWSGEHVDAVVIQADHDEYADLDPGDYPGVQVIYDGRRVVDADVWARAGAEVLTIGQGSKND